MGTIVVDYRHIRDYATWSHIAKKSLQFLFAHKTDLAQDIANVLPINHFETQMEA